MKMAIGVWMVASLGRRAVAFPDLQRPKGRKREEMEGIKPVAPREYEAFRGGGEREVATSEASLPYRRTTDDNHRCGRAQEAFPKREGKQMHLDIPERANKEEWAIRAVWAGR